MNKSLCPNCGSANTDHDQPKGFYCLNCGQGWGEPDYTPDWEAGHSPFAVRDSLAVKARAIEINMNWNEE